MRNDCAGKHGFVKLVIVRSTQCIFDYLGRVLSIAFACEVSGKRFFFGFIVFVKLPVIDIRIESTDRTTGPSGNRADTGCRSRCNRLPDRFRQVQLVDFTGDSWHQCGAGSRTQCTGKSAAECACCCVGSDAIGSSFSPVLCFGMELCCLRGIAIQLCSFGRFLQGVQFPAGIVANRLGCLLPERLRGKLPMTSNKPAMKPLTAPSMPSTAI